MACDTELARPLLVDDRMETPPPRHLTVEAWTIPFHIILWTTLLVGLIMVIAVLLMH